MDVILRYVFDAPLRGVSVVTGLALVLATFLTVAYAQREKPRVSIDLLAGKLSPKGKLVLNNILYCLSIGAIALIARRSLAAGRLIGMLFLLVVTSLLFGYFIAGSNIPSILKEFLAAGSLPPLVGLITICVFYLVLGFLMDPIAIMLITVPIFYPVVLALGHDPIWFGVVVVLLMSLACITPPFGVILFAFKGVTGISLSTVFRGVIPFVVVTLVVLALIVAFPQIAISLPNLLRLSP